MPVSDYDAKRTTYDPVEYWSNRLELNGGENPTVSQVEIDIFQKSLTGADSVLEVGPGIGRLFPLYPGINRVATIDISRIYADRASKYAAELGLSVSDYYLDDPNDPYPFAENEFDVGVASRILMHVPFENIKNTMSEIARCCKRVVVISMLHRYWPKNGMSYDKRWHCFAHDYESICEEIGCTYESYKLISKNDDEEAFTFSFRKFPKLEMEPVAKTRKKAIVFLAHPDDCVIFCQHFIQKYHHDYDFKILYLTSIEDDARVMEMKNYWGIKGVPVAGLGRVNDISDLKEKKVPISFFGVVDMLKPEIKDADLILTHGKGGEYGHPHHVFCHFLIDLLVDPDVVTLINVAQYGQEMDLEIVGFIDVDISLLPIHAESIMDYSKKINCLSVGKYLVIGSAGSEFKLGKVPL